MRKTLGTLGTAEKMERKEELLTSLLIIVSVLMNNHKVSVQFLDRDIKPTHLRKPVRERWRRTQRAPAIRTSPEAASALIEIERD